MQMYILRRTNLNKVSNAGEDFGAYVYIYVSVNISSHIHILLCIYRMHQILIRRSFFRTRSCLKKMYTPLCLALHLFGLHELCLETFVSTKVLCINFTQYFFTKKFIFSIFKKDWIFYRNPIYF